MSNAIKRDHQRYLALGGLGFLLGDGRLNYAREDIVETYYTAHAWRGLFLSLGGSAVFHPGYNQDRGPVLVPSLYGRMWTFSSGLFTLGLMPMSLVWDAAWPHLQACCSAAF